MKFRFSFALILISLTACDAIETPSTVDAAESGFMLSAILESRELDEVSGIQSSAGGVFFLHNDSGSPSVYIAGPDGRNLGKVRIRDAKNRDWEDISRVPGPDGPLLVLGDIGDNQARYKSVRLYFVAEPRTTRNEGYPEKVDLLHKLKIRYPDGPRDCEAMAYDAGSKMILFLTKRDHPPRLYGLPLDQALQNDAAELQYLGDVPSFTPPTANDLLRHKKPGKWFSQPTGLDISSDGRRAAVITYSSLYVFERAQGESWARAFLNTPIEYTGPPSLQNESVTFGFDEPAVYVSSEHLPAPIYRLEIHL